MSVEMDKAVIRWGPLCRKHARQIVGEHRSPVDECDTPQWLNGLGEVIVCDARTYLGLPNPEIP